MAKVTIQIDMDQLTVKDEPQTELAKILRSLAKEIGHDTIDFYFHPACITDGNCNNVGVIEYELDEDEE